MNSYDFSGYALKGELDLNRLAQRLGIGRRYRWEDPMVLDPTELRPPAEGTDRGRRVYLYFFGAAVFVNCPEDAVQDFCARMSTHWESLRELPSVRFRDDYALQTGDGNETVITNDYAVMPLDMPLYHDIISFVIAKSVALERIEERLDQVLDEIEGLIQRLERGRLRTSDKRLARMASTILSFKYASLANIMVLGKPDSTWENEEADRLYLTMANLFELKQRYSEIRHKSETLLDITEVFSSLSHARRASRLEWIIIVLIFIEVVIFVAEILARRG